MVFERAGTLTCEYKEFRWNVAHFFDVSVLFDETLSRIHSISFFQSYGQVVDEVLMNSLDAKKGPCVIV